MPEVDKLSPGHRPIAVILLCVFALLLFALQDSIIKGLSQQYPLLQVLSFRSGIVLVLLVAVGLYLQGRGILRGRNPLPMLTRVVRFSFN